MSDNKPPLKKYAIVKTNCRWKKLTKISGAEISCRLNNLDQNEFHQYDFGLGVFIF